MGRRLQLSEFEIEVMNEVWLVGECCAPALHKKISQHKPVTYSTVKTIIDRLEKKGALKRSRSEGRMIYMRAAVTSQAVQRSMLSRFVKHLFGDQPKLLFNHLLSSEKLSDDDLDYLEGVIDQIRQERRDD